jgi:Predicted carboxypeptidase
MSISSKLPEIEQIEEMIRSLGSSARTEILAESSDGHVTFPIHKITIGSEDPTAPVLGLTGGVHGLERIGSQVCLALMHSLIELLKWDKSLNERFKNFRVFFIPVVNPVGIYNKTRCNPHGVDLMRNSPIESTKPAFLLGGHRYSNKLPWYRGDEGKPMEIEAQALIDGVAKEIMQSKLAVTVDLHSGFGLQDRLWFPYAKSTEPYPDLPFMHAFKDLMDRAYPHHFYKIEPQAQNYTTHGDLWDYLYDDYRKINQGMYLPLCLEMGSWSWVKKHPSQIFSSMGPFNPMVGHRLKRTLRRHNTLMEFLLRATESHEAWSQLSDAMINEHNQKAKELWYEPTAK